MMTFRTERGQSSAVEDLGGELMLELEKTRGQSLSGVGSRRGGGDG